MFLLCKMINKGDLEEGSPFFFTQIEIIMIQFNELKISPDNQELIIDVSVKDLSIYSNVYLDSIIIDNQDTFTNNGPSSNPIYSFTIEDEYNPVYSVPEFNGCNPVLEEDTESQCFTEAKGVKHYRLVLTGKDISMSGNLFFVYVVAKGTPDPSTPCTMDNMTTLGVACNLHDIFQSCMSYIRELESSCNIPKGFIDYILRFKALELSLATGNYITAIKYWNKFFKNKSFSNPSTCNCHHAST